MSNINYYNLYKKYKYKYINAKQSIVSKKGGDSNSFTLYTTGLTGIDPNLYNKYKENLYNQIYENYINLTIKHYDPDPDPNNICNTLNIIKDDNEKYNFNDKTCKSEFINKPFEEEFDKIDLSKPYLILDFAHLYYFNKEIKNVYTSNIYKKDKLDSDPTLIYNINVLRVGYLGDVIPQKIFSQQKLISFENKVLYTYIDKMILLCIEISKEPYDFFNNTIKLISTHLFTYLKKHFNDGFIANNKTEFIISHDCIKIDKLLESIITHMFNKLWNGTLTNDINKEAIEISEKIFKLLKESNFDEKTITTFKL
jgi:hypothetical protein